MDKSQLVKLLLHINGINSDTNSDCGIAANRLEETIKKLCRECKNLKSNLLSDDCLCDESRRNDFEWKYLHINFFLLELLNTELSKSPMNILSVQETKDVKAALQTVVLQTVLKNIEPNLPFHVPTRSLNPVQNSVDRFLNKYDLMKTAVSAFHRCIKLRNLRALILPHCMRGILVATFQMAHCPLKKPASKADGSSFVMTEETYGRLLKDQQLFVGILEDMRTNIHPAIFVKETMMLLRSDAPVWFKRSVSSALTRMLTSEGGVRHVALAMLDSPCDDDTTKTWQILDVLTKLLVSCRKMRDFQRNICAQILDLLQLVRATDREMFVFERLVVSCTRSLFSQDRESCEAVFVRRITAPLLYLTDEEHEFRDGDDITDDLKQTVRLISGCFVDNVANLPCLPTELLSNVISVTFLLYHLTVNSTFQTTSGELAEILIKYLRNSTQQETYDLLDNFIFGFTVEGTSRIRNDVVLEVSEKIVVKKNPHSLIYATSHVTDSIFKLFPSDQKIILFEYLLKCITNKEKYPLRTHHNQELLNLEDNAVSVVFELILAVHRVLTLLSEDKDVQLSLRNNPQNVVEYMINVLSDDKSDSEIIFIIVMLLDNLLSNSSGKVVQKYNSLREHLTRTSKDTTNVELKRLCGKIVNAIEGKGRRDTNPQAEVTEFQKALEDVCDPLLPTRGHALLVLSKLLEKKDEEAVERKQYLLNLFRLHLKDEDSYIYLSAVQGLAALADAFSDSVLEILCEEYADFSKKGDDAQETRMKLGEVLVRVIKLLGDMAPKYKALLLNTFLSGTKDDDHLIRASSLSSLGEVCRVLHYKLGTVVTEVLVCVHAVITTDKAIEARRAAVTVIRQLFVGLQSETIEFLKEEILPVYRTLKDLYYNDNDDVTRLQAQLALEELNENVRNFAFPKPQIHGEKKIILMD